MSEDTNKSVTKTVSMPEGIWSAIDRHAATLGCDRSTFLRGLAIKALRDAGMLHVTAKEEIIGIVEALYDTMEPNALKAELEAITAKSLSV